MDAVGQETFGERMDRLGMPFGEEQLAHARSLVMRYGFVPEELSDIQLMTICVEAYGKPDHDLPMWI
ncbi:MAG: hypothetical protein ABI888_00885 [Chloroflexota bacterium]